MRPPCVALLLLLSACQHVEPAREPDAARPAPPAEAPRAAPETVPEAVPPAPSPSAPRVSLVGSRGPASVTVRLALDKESQEHGLQGVRHLAADEGMLFVFDDDQDRNFWMKGTPIALDIIFINARLEVVGVVRNARAMSETTRSVGRLSRYVLEVNAGWADAHGVDTGARAAFTNVPLP